MQPEVESLKHPFRGCKMYNYELGYAEQRTREEAKKKKKKEI